MTKESNKIQYRNNANCRSILKCLTDFWISWLKYPFWKWLKNQYLMRLGSLVEVPQQCTLMARVAASAVQRIGIPLFLVSFKIQINVGWGITINLTHIFLCRLWCSTCLLVFGCCELSYLIFLKLRKKELLAKLRKIAEWQPFLLKKIT